MAIEGSTGQCCWAQVRVGPCTDLGLGRMAPTRTHPIEQLDEVGSVGKQVGHQRNAVRSQDIPVR